MLILNMLLRITGFTQEELANYIGVSRASINSWLTDDSNMSDNSKRLICEKFQFPYSFFDIDLNQSLEYYKLVFSTLYENWNRLKVNKTDDKSINNKINDILNKIESDITPVHMDKVDDVELLDGLANGYDPFTGVVFDKNHILQNPDVKNLLNRIYNNYKSGNFIMTKDDLTEEQLDLFEELRAWRRDKYIEEGYFHAYLVFNDRELINIITANITSKEQLRKVSGIGAIKYNKYADELYEIIINRKYVKKEEVNNDQSIIGCGFPDYNNAVLEDKDLPF